MDLERFELVFFEERDEQVRLELNAQACEIRVQVPIPVTSHPVVLLAGCKRQADAPRQQQFLGLNEADLYRM